MNQLPQPESVFRYFAEIASIPHGSGNTGMIRKWALDTAEKLHCPAYADETGNVVIRKAASAGYEDHPGVILQGHMDMVCAKEPDCQKNMETEGLDLIWGDTFLTADGTTLGGDDGIAVAYAFAILEDDSIPHPPLTVILTVDEETGMDGATGLAPDALTGKYLINIDSEQEGVFTVGCAGGIRVHMQEPAETQETSGTSISLTVSGLIGGHSGTEIHKPLLNANLVMLALLRAVSSPIALCAWQGGVRDNVIPTDCTAALIVSAEDAAQIRREITAQFDAIKAENPQETGMTLQINCTTESTAIALTTSCTSDLLRSLDALPNGVQEMHAVLPMPETSLNLGVFALKDGVMHVDALIRSGNNAKKAALAEKLHAHIASVGGTASDSGAYPAWEYIPDTALEKTATAVYTEMYGKPPVIETIHAGLECGILAAKAPQLSCISIGPDILDIHTPRERLSLASTARTWDFLIALLQSL